MHEQFDAAKQFDDMMDAVISSLERFATGPQMDRMATAVATAARKYHAAFLQEGFTNDHSISLTASCLRSHLAGVNN